MRHMHTADHCDTVVARLRPSPPPVASALCRSTDSGDSSSGQPHRGERRVSGTLCWLSAAVAALAVGDSLEASARRMAELAHRGLEDQ